MQDDRGYYYYPIPTDKKIRMYVRKEAGQIEFRLWNSEDDLIWDRHKWIPMEAIRQAAALYGKDKPDPLKLYDLQVAEAVLQGSKDDKK